MLGLTSLGTIHTAISLIAVVAGLIAFVRDKEISPRNGVGKIYVIATVLTCLTAFGIFQHGGFGKPHALGIITLVVLGVAYVAGYTKLYGRLSPYIETVSYSATFLFQMIPGITETSTRLPLGAPRRECRSARPAGGDCGVVRRVPDRRNAAGAAVAGQAPTGGLSFRDESPPGLSSLPFPRAVAWVWVMSRPTLVQNRHPQTVPFR